MCLRCNKYREKMSQEVDFVTEIKGLTPKRPSKTALFLASLVEKMEKAIYDECLLENRISLNVKYASGTIEIYMTSQGDCKVAVIHADNEHNSPTLEATIAGSVPDWWAIRSRAEEDERTEQEFRDYLWRNCRYW